MKIKVNTNTVGNQTEITVYINDSTMSATDAMCIVHHLCYYGTMTSLCTRYPFKEVKIFIPTEEVSVLFKSLEDDGFSVVMA